MIVFAATTVKALFGGSAISSDLDAFNFWDQSFPQREKLFNVPEKKKVKIQTYFESFKLFIKAPFGTQLVRISLQHQK